MRKTGKNPRSKTRNTKPVSEAPAQAPVEDHTTGYRLTGRHYLYVKGRKAEYEVYMYDPDEQLHKDEREAPPVYDPYGPVPDSEAGIQPFHAVVPTLQEDEGGIAPFVVGQPAPIPPYLQAAGHAPDRPPTTEAPAAHSEHPASARGEEAEAEEPASVPGSPSPHEQHEHTGAEAASHNGTGTRESLSTGPMTEPAMTDNTGPFAMIDSSLSSSSSSSSGSLTSPMFEPYEAQLTVWDDASLASVEDFTTVLLAMQSGTGGRDRGDGVQAGSGEGYDGSQVSGRTSAGQSTQSVEAGDSHMVEARPHEPLQAAQQDGHGQGQQGRDGHDGTPLPEGQEASDEYALFISDLAAHLRAEKQQAQEQEQAPGQEPAEQSPVQPRLAATTPQAEAGPDITAMEGAATDEAVLTAPAGEQELLAEMEGVAPFSPEETAPAAADAYAGSQGDDMPEAQARLQADVPAEPEHAQPGEHDAAYADQAQEQAQAQEAPGEQAEMEGSETAGRFRGDELQFEDFMFDRGAPLSPETSSPAMVAQAFQPTEAEAVVVQGAADAVSEPEPPEPQELRPITLPVPSQSISPDEDEADQLPFWLRDTAELTAIPELQYLTAEEADEAEWAQGTAVVPDALGVPETPVSAAAGQVEAEIEAEVEAEADGRHEPGPPEPAVPDDYLDLPPIEPFDFSILQLAEEVARPAEDSLGFRTGELLGSMVPVQESEPAGSTMEAGLNALDRLLEVGPPPLLETAPAGADGDVSIEATAAGDAPYTGEYSEYDQYGAQTGQTEPGVGMDAGTADRPTTFIRPAGTANATGGTDRPFNWTSMITGSLMAEAETHGGESTGEADASMGETAGAVELNDAYPTALIGSTGSAEETTVSDLGVDPFDFSKLDLEDEEPPTEFLPASATQPVLVPGTEKLHTSVGMGANGGTAPAPRSLQAGAEAEEAQSEPDITGALPSFEEEDEEELWRELGSDTSLFITSHLPQTSDETESGKSPATNWLGGASGDGEEALQQETADAQDHTQMDTHVEGIKARVTSDVWATRRMLTLQDLESFDVVEASEAGTEESPALETEPEPESRARVEAETEAEAEAQSPPSEPAVEVPPKPHHKATRPLMVEPPAPPRPRVEPDDVGTMDSGPGSLVSGPLPVLDGFEELLELVTYSPQDMGAHMALAAAYTQAGNLDAALRVYRRMLKKRNNVPAYMLQIIAEELADFEDEFGDRPRFHQVRGDLYMKQGRFREAVEEYNKIK